MSAEKESSGWFGWLWGSKKESGVSSSAEDKLVVQQAFEELHAASVQERVKAYQKQIDDSAPVEELNAQTRAALYKAEAEAEAKGVITDKKRETDQGGLLSGIWGLLGGGKVAEVSPVEARMQHVKEVAANLGNVHKAIAAKRQEQAVHKYATPGEEWEKKTVEGKDVWTAKEKVQPPVAASYNDPKEALPEPKKFTAQPNMVALQQGLTEKLKFKSYADAVKSSDGESQGVSL